MAQRRLRCHECLPRALPKTSGLTYGAAMRTIALLPATALLTLALGSASADAPTQCMPSVQADTGCHARVLDRAAAARLLGATGITLQWIGWDRRGPLAVSDTGGVFRVSGSQADAPGTGRLWLDGVVREIGADYFLFDGTVRITDAPDPGRMCEANRSWRFAVTQNRRYWRLRVFEWCDELTDYIDIYF